MIDGALLSTHGGLNIFVSTSSNGRRAVQYHFNGFKPGDPDIRHGSAEETPDTLPAEVDVLIVGCGPAGLTLAAQLAAFADIKTRIVEQKTGPLLVGQADGIACRTMEMFEAFGFADRVLKEAYWVNETAFWKQDDATPEHIVRSDRIQDTEDGLSEFPHVILNQARVHDFYLNAMRNAPARLTPNYGRRLVDLTIDPDDVTHKVSVTLERVDPAHQGQAETLRARYVVGCDGARSAVRRCLGLALHGDSANQVWGVMDILAVTDFPDIRIKSAIRSAHEGSLLIIPREGGYMVRMYVEIDKLGAAERAASRNITADQLVAAARRILHPFTLEVKEIAWWSVYEIGQRLCGRFDDVPEDEVSGRLPHVFIAGDACHTHSPKAGQGMNVSMQDGFNLGWKLAAVLRGQSAPALLRTYSAERQAIAAELIDFDRQFAGMFSAGAKANADPAAFQRYFVRQARYTAGTETLYRESMITGAPVYQHLAAGLAIGMRFHSAPVVRLADAKPMELGHVVKADGRWRLFAFDAATPSGVASDELRDLCTFLAESPASPMVEYRAPYADLDSVIDMRVVFQRSHRELALESMPGLLMPPKGRYGLLDYEKMFCADRKHERDIFDLRGIDRASGCLVIVRPDQYVAHVSPLTAHAALAAFFQGVLVPARALTPAGF
jgi:phenol 2-monooxygenase